MTKKSNPSVSDGVGSKWSPLRNLEIADHYPHFRFGIVDFKLKFKEDFRNSQSAIGNWNNVPLQVFSGETTPILLIKSQIITGALQRKGHGWR